MYREVPDHPEDCAGSFYIAVITVVVVFYLIFLFMSPVL